MDDPIVYLYSPEVIIRDTYPPETGFVINLYLGNVKVGRFKIFPEKDYGSMYDINKLVSTGAAASMYLGSDEYDNQLNDGKIFQGVRVKVYSPINAEAFIMMGDVMAENSDTAYLYDGLYAILDSGTAILDHLGELNGYLNKLREELIAENTSHTAQEYLRVSTVILHHILNIVQAQAQVVKKIFESEFNGNEMEPNSDS